LFAFVVLLLYICVPCLDPITVFWISSS